MKKLLLLTLAIATLTSEGYSQNRPIQRGGIIVYEEDGHGLVAAPTDFEQDMDWLEAKEACDTLTLNGYSDWRLPSKEELNQLYLNKDKIGGFASGYYSSSTEDSPNYAWVQGFDDGIQYWYNKYTANTVRAVRSF